MILEPTLDEIQKLLMLIKFLGMQGLSLAIGPLVGAEGSIPKAVQKQSQVERLRKELDEQISRYLSTQLPDAAEVKVLMLVCRLGTGIDAMGREAVRIGELAYGPMPSREVAQQVVDLFEIGCEVLNHSVEAFFEFGASTGQESLNRAKEHADRLAVLLERSRHAQEGGAALIAAVSRVALQAQASSDEIAAFIATSTAEKHKAQVNALNRPLRIGRS